MTMQDLADETIESIRKQLVEATTRTKDSEKQLADLTKDYMALKQAYTEVKIRLTDISLKYNSSSANQQPVAQGNETQLLKEKYEGLKYRYKVSLTTTGTLQPSCPSSLLHIKIVEGAGNDSNIMSCKRLYASYQQIDLFMSYYYIWFQHSFPNTHIPISIVS